MQSLKKLSCVALAAIVLTACGSGGGGDPAPSAPNPVPVPAPAPTAAELATAVIVRLNTLFAAAVPSTGAAAFDAYDDCYLSNGYTKAREIAEFDANKPQSIASNAYRIGSVRSNLRVLAERTITNADSSTRKEIDVLYDVAYTDGSVNSKQPETVITGSSYGICGTQQSSATPRFLGNQKIVGTSINARNERTEQYTKVTGVPKSIPAYYFNSLQFNVNDPQGTASYAIVTGPGGDTVSGVYTPFSFKLLSTRLLKSDSLLVGKSGNYDNWNPNDGFRLCRVGSSTGAIFPASATDCTLGASGRNYGRRMDVVTTGANPAQIAERDASFASLGFTVGGTYTFKIYNDNGWKTIGGVSDLFSGWGSSS